MKLSLLQWLVMLAILAMCGAALLDIAGVISPPDRVWIIVPLVLAPIAWLVLPSMRDIKRSERRRG